MRCDSVQCDTLQCDTVGSVIICSGQGSSGVCSALREEHTFPASCALAVFPDRGAQGSSGHGWVPSHGCLPSSPACTLGQGQHWGLCRSQAEQSSPALQSSLLKGMAGQVELEPPLARALCQGPWQQGAGQGWHKD